MPTVCAPAVPPNRRPAGVLLTAAGPQMRGVMQDVALPTFRRYAERWGYEVFAAALAADGVGADSAAQRAKWEKIRLIRQYLTEYRLVVWLDADVLLVRDDEDIAEHLHPAHFQALALEQVPAEHRVNPNTGVWLMRSERRAFDFLDAVEAAGPQPGPWADQGAVLAALGWHRGDEQYRWAGPGRGSRFLAGTSWLPPGWNQPYVTGRAESEIYNGSASSYLDRPVVSTPHALHFMGMTPTARHRHMSTVVRALSAPGVHTRALHGTRRLA